VRIVSKTDPEHLIPSRSKTDPFPHQPQLLQLLLEHDAQPPVPDEGEKSPLLLNPHADRSRSSLSPRHWGQEALSSEPKTSASNSF
jgi:hypothetical protein